MAEHTPGPWKCRKDYDHHWVSAGNGKRAIQIADVSDIEIGTGTGEVDTDVKCTEANARLIAAAPDLLAACEEAMEFLANGTPIHPGALVQASIFNAIAKAKP